MSEDRLFPLGPPAADGKPSRVAFEGGLQSSDGDGGLIPSLGNFDPAAMLPDAASRLIGMR
jgi:hypothetical protein